MRLSQIVSLATLAGLSHAFLIPSTLSLSEKKTVDAIPFEAQTAVSGADFMLDCPGCPVVLSTSNIVSHALSKLHIKVAVQKNADNDDSLLINDIPVLPVAPSAVSQGMHADQLIQGPDDKWVVAANPELGYLLHIRPFHDRKHQGVTVYNVHLRIREVGQELVRWTSVLDIKVVRTAGGKLMILRSHVSGSRLPPHHDVVAVLSAPECTNVLCKWRVTLFEKVGSFRKGCGRNGGPARHPRPNGIFKGPHGRPRPVGFQHSRPHPHNRHGHGHGRPLTVTRFINNIFSIIIIPMVIGAALGVVASIVGAMVGHLIVFIWRVLFRRGQRGHCNNQRDALDVDEEKTGLMDEQMAPPVYEDAFVDDKTEQK